MAMKKLKMLEWRDGQPGCGGLNRFGCRVELKVEMATFQDMDTLLFYCPACAEKIEVETKAKKKPVMDKAMQKLADEARQLQTYGIKKIEDHLDIIEQYAKEIRGRLSGKIKSSQPLEGVEFAAHHLAEETLKLHRATIKAAAYEAVEVDIATVETRISRP